MKLREGRGLHERSKASWARFEVRQGSPTKYGIEKAMMMG